MDCPAEITEYMHSYLDGDLSAKNEKILREHLQKCSSCQNHFHELNSSIMVLKNAQRLQAPENFTAKVMTNLPKENKGLLIKRWFKNRPFFAAAALFLLLMSGTFFASLNKDEQLSVTKQDSLIIDNNVVIVPEGEIIEGDLVVKNGQLKIEGQIKGNVTIINGEIINGENYLASTSQVSGEINEVNELFELLWYKIKSSIKKIGKLFSGS